MNIQKLIGYGRKVLKDIRLFVCRYYKNVCKLKFYNFDHVYLIILSIVAMYGVSGIDFGSFCNSHSSLGYVCMSSNLSKYEKAKDDQYASSTTGYANRKQRKKILLIGSNLVNGQGGVEHVLCNMANTLSNNENNVIIATMENKKGDTFYYLNNNVKFVNVYENISLFEIIKIICSTKKSRYVTNLSYRNRIWNKLISKEQPDLIICFSLPLLLEVTYRKDFNVPIILTVHGNPINDYSNRFILRSEYENDLLKCSYQKADVIQVLLDSYKATIPDSFKGEVVTISNIAPNFDNSTINYDKVGQKKIVCIASLDDRKHQDLLIKSFSVIAGQYNDWIVELWGSGYKREQYKQLIKDLKMEKRIFLRGSTKDVYSVLKDTDIFALPSTCEGWPLVLGEAMSLGIPCIGLSDCDGVNEIVKHRINGVLSADTEEDFTEQLKFLMDHKNERKQYGMQAKNDMKDHSEQIVWGQWKDLIFKYLRNKK